MRSTTRPFILASLGALILLAPVSCASKASTEKVAAAPAATASKTVNTVCVIENEDEVHPSVPAVTWRGQQVGFCCPGCVKQWNAMTDAQKDEAVKTAVALSK
ncbi:MAG: hypothetical protein KF745_01165 [Phycisphaeraceae bacterium]|nr:hypothetical protein [Phycisphaeraceae bacterium]